MENNKKTLIVGLGNPILSDDGVGIRVVQLLKDRINKPDITLVEASVAGLDFLDLITGYDKVIIIDALEMAEGKVGEVYQLELGTFAATRHTGSPHDVNFATAIELGKRLGITLPHQIIIFGILVADITTFSEKCTPRVEQAIPVCTRMVEQLVNGENNVFSGQAEALI